MCPLRLALRSATRRSSSATAACPLSSAACRSAVSRASDRFAARAPARRGDFGAAAFVEYIDQCPILHRSLRYSQGISPISAVARHRRGGRTASSGALAAMPKPKRHDQLNSQRRRLFRVLGSCARRSSSACDPTSFAAASPPAPHRKLDVARVFRVRTGTLCAQTVLLASRTPYRRARSVSGRATVAARAGRGGYD